MISFFFFSFNLFCNGREQVVIGGVWNIRWVLQQFLLFLEYHFGDKWSIFVMMKDYPTTIRQSSAFFTNRGIKFPKRLTCLFHLAGVACSKRFHWNPTKYKTISSCFAFAADAALAAVCFQVLFRCTLTCVSCDQTFQKSLVFMTCVIKKMQHLYGSDYFV